MSHACSSPSPDRAAIRAFLGERKARLASALESGRLPRLRWDLFGEFTAGHPALPRQQADALHYAFGEEFERALQLVVQRKEGGGFGHILLWSLLGALAVAILLKLTGSAALDTSNVFFLN